MVRTEDRALYNVDRKEASDFLQVSERTVDRYIRAGKLTFKKVGHHVYLSKDELESLKNTLVQNVEQVSIVSESKAHEQKAVAPIDLSSASYKDIENQIFKNLYDNTKQELDKKQREVEILNYRLGKIEFEIKNTVPLLEYSKEKDTLEDQNAELKSLMEVKEKELSEAFQSLRIERKIKSVYLVFVLAAILFGSIGILLYFGAIRIV
ncbi:MAG: helix-turn-helix domain-containing protein [Candidatus Gracilibacteria bacterium]